MNPKILVGVAVAALAGILGMVLLAGQSDIGPGTGPSFEPIRAELGGITIDRISERSATITVAIDVSNPNPGAVRVQVLDYQLYETGYSESEQVSGGQIGSRPGGLVEFGSDYYILLGDGMITLKDEVVIRNTGNTPELWERLTAGDASWRVSGDIFYNLSSVTAGGENELHFEFEQ